MFYVMANDEIVTIERSWTTAVAVLYALQLQWSDEREGPCPTHVMEAKEVISL